MTFSTCMLSRSVNKLPYKCHFDLPQTSVQLFIMYHSREMHYNLVVNSLFQYVCVYTISVYGVNVSLHIVNICGLWNIPVWPCTCYSNRWETNTICLVSSTIYASLISGQCMYTHLIPCAIGILFTSYCGYDRDYLIDHSRDTSGAVYSIFIISNMYGSS